MYKDYSMVKEQCRQEIIGLIASSRIKKKKTIFGGGQMLIMSRAQRLSDTQNHQCDLYDFDIVLDEVKKWL